MVSVNAFAELSKSKVQNNAYSLHARAKPANEKPMDVPWALLQIPG